MKIAVASGKGGTGKTTVAVNLAVVLSDRGSVELLDCDVEAPNAHLFLDPTIERQADVALPVPVVDDQKCTGCGLCVEVCEFNAIGSIGKGVLVFPELCHGCGACWKLCPEDAITPGQRQVGTVGSGHARSVAFHHGWLRVGEALSPPVVRAVKALATGADFTILDAPPGTSCPVVETVRGADTVLLVTEPTPFGLHDLELAADMAQALGLAAAVAINKVGIGDGAVEEFCASRSLPVVLRLPYERRIAEAYSRGELIAESVPELRADFERLADYLLEHARR